MGGTPPVDQTSLGIPHWNVSRAPPPIPLRPSDWIWAVAFEGHADPAGPGFAQGSLASCAVRLGLLPTRLTAPSPGRLTTALELRAVAFWARGWLTTSPPPRKGFHLHQCPCPAHLRPPASRRLRPLTSVLASGHLRSQGFEGPGAARSEGPPNARPPGARHQRKFSS